MSWVRIHQAHGHVCPKKATGNIFSQRQIDGVGLFNLTLFRLIQPKVYLSEVKAYIHSINGAIQPYSNSQITWAEQRLGLWLKVGSTTSDQAHLPINLLKLHMYWQEVFPYRIYGEETDYIIDIDKAMFKFESQECKRDNAALPSFAMETSAMDPNLGAADPYGPIQGMRRLVHSCCCLFLCLGRQNTTH
jgi:hypothetical protein